MVFLMELIKKVIVLASIALAATVVLNNSLLAQNDNTEITSPPKQQGINSCTDQTSCLRAITQNTYGALQILNAVPDYLNSITKMANSWLTSDDSKSTEEMQKNFAATGDSIIQNINAQNKLQQQLTVDLLNLSSAASPPATPFSVGDLSSQNPRSTANIPININDISYTTLLGMPPSPKTSQQTSPYNFIRYASAFPVPHAIPRLSWNARTREDGARYISFYTTVMAAESFNGYILSERYAELQNGKGFSTAQQNLISQASNSSWIAEVATEELGKVLRQLLMFSSQSYVLLSEMLQTQKDMLTAQVMTNSLLIINAQVNEGQLVTKAQGLRPT